MKEVDVEILFRSQTARYVHSKHPLRPIFLYKEQQQVILDNIFKN